jgi:hypothetical protein
MKWRDPPVLTMATTALCSAVFWALSAEAKMLLAVAATGLAASLFYLVVQADSSVTLLQRQLQTTRRWPTSPAIPSHDRYPGNWRGRHTLLLCVLWLVLRVKLGRSPKAR